MVTWEVCAHAPLGALSAKNLCGRWHHSPSVGEGPGSRDASRWASASARAGAIVRGAARAARRCSPFQLCAFITC